MLRCSFPDKECQKREEVKIFNFLGFSDYLSTRRGGAGGYEAGCCPQEVCCQAENLQRVAKCGQGFDDQGSPVLRGAVTIMGVERNGSHVVAVCGEEFIKYPLWMSSFSFKKPVFPAGESDSSRKKSAIYASGDRSGTCRIG